MNSKVVHNNQKHLTLEQRIQIEQFLNQNYTFKDIGKILKKDPTTISKEIRKHRTQKTSASFNKCAKRETCSKKNVCGSSCKLACRSCKICNLECDEFEPILCKTLQSPPYVCNGCSKKASCKADKLYYHAFSSFKEYRCTLSSSREGIRITDEKLCDLDSLVSPLIKQGLSISHIYSTHKELFPCTKRTLYNYIDKKYLSVANIDLPRKVRYKKRKSKKKLPKKDSAIRLNRTYKDFIEHTLLNPDLPIVEMDTVEGVKGGKVLLTLIFRSCKLMLAFILNDKTTASVLSVFNQLETSLGNELFEKTFPIILTDNGSEFSNPLSLEFNAEGVARTRIFYCDPNASYQKGSIEKNHEFIRYIIPKGKSMDKYTQEDITFMINNINSVARDSLNGSSPFDLATLLIDNYVLDALNLKKIDPDNILLKPYLI